MSYDVRVGSALEEIAKALQWQARVAEQMLAKQTEQLAIYRKDRQDACDRAATSAIAGLINREGALADIAMVLKEDYNDEVK